MNLRHAAAHFVRSVAYSSLLIAAGASAQVWLFYREMGLRSDHDLIMIVGFATVAVYVLQRSVRFAGQAPQMISERHRWMEKYRILLLVLAGVCVIATGILTLGSFTPAWWVFAPFMLITLLYSMPLPKTGPKRYGLRELPYFKILFIAITWAAVTVMLPAIDLGQVAWPALLLIGFERLLFVFAITVPFDIRDMPHDDGERRTLPQVFGIQRSKGIAIFALALSYAFIIARSTTDMALVVGLGITYILAAWLVLRSHFNRRELFFTGALDGMLLLGPLLVSLLSSC